MTDTLTPSNLAAPTNRPRVLILGAHGRFGHAATQAFAEAGWDVLAQVRRAPETLSTGVTPITTLLTDMNTLREQAEGCRAVVYAINPHYTRWPQELLPLARLGMDLASALGACFMLPGNVYNFGADMPLHLREDTPQQARTRKGTLRCQLEAEMHTRAQRQGLNSIVLRAGDFFGPPTGTWLDMAILKSLPQGKWVYPGPLDRVHTWTYLPDLAHTLVALANLPLPTTPSVRCWHHGGHALTGAELLTHLEHTARQLNLIPPDRAPLKRGHLPWTLIRWGGTVIPMWRELAEMAYLWEVPHVLDDHALRSTLNTAGMPLQHTPLKQALWITLRTWAAQNPLYSHRVVCEHPLQNTL